MKKYSILLVCLIILLAGFSLAPVFAFPATVDVSWEKYADAYSDPEFKIFLPTILR